MVGVGRGVRLTEERQRGRLGLGLRSRLSRGRSWSRRRSWQWSRSSWSSVVWSWSAGQSSWSRGPRWSSLVVVSLGGRGLGRSSRAVVSGVVESVVVTTLEPVESVPVDSDRSPARPECLSRPILSRQPVAPGRGRRRGARRGGTCRRGARRRGARRGGGRRDDGRAAERDSGHGRNGDARRRLRRLLRGRPGGPRFSWLFRPAISVRQYRGVVSSGRRVELGGCALRLSPGCGAAAYVAACAVCSGAGER